MAYKKMERECALCHRIKALRKSHVIPNSAFKKIKRSLNGKAIVLTDDDHTWIQYSSDSWWEYLLCGECEHRISNYERYFFEVLRSNNANIREIHEHGITFKNLIYKNIKLFLQSLLWKAAVSNQPNFGKVILHPTWAEELRISLFDERPLSQLKFGCKISKLNDPTPGGFSMDALDQLVISPIPRILKRSILFLFIIEGYLFEYFCPSIPFSKSRDYGIYRNNDIFFVPFQPVLNIPEIMDLMINGYSKNIKGMAKLRKR